MAEAASAPQLRREAAVAPLTQDAWPAYDAASVNARRSDKLARQAAPRPKRVSAAARAAGERQLKTQKCTYTICMRGGEFIPQLAKAEAARVLTMPTLELLCAGRVASCGLGLRLRLHQRLQSRRRPGTLPGIPQRLLTRPWGARKSILDG